MALVASPAAAASATRVIVFVRIVAAPVGSESGSRNTADETREVRRAEAALLLAFGDGSSDAVTSVLDVPVTSVETLEVVVNGVVVNSLNAQAAEAAAQHEGHGLVVGVAVISGIAAACFVVIGAYFAWQKQRLRQLEQQQEMLYGPAASRKAMEQKMAKSFKDDGMSRSCWDSLECCAPDKYEPGKL